MRMNKTFKELLSKQEQLYESLAQLVEEHGVALAILHNSMETDHFVNDFVFYCVTKGCKSTKSILALIDNSLPEDALTLCRSVYECYINASYAITHPEHIDHLTTKKVGLHSGIFIYQITRKGRYNPRIIVNTETGEEMESGPTIESLVKGTGYAEDQPIHEILYPFLSEHAHVHMMASGNYRSLGVPSKYDFSRTDNITQAIFTGAYVSLLLFSRAASFASREGETPDQTQLIMETRIILLQVLKIMCFEDDFFGFDELIIKRIERCLE